MFVLLLSACTEPEVATVTVTEPPGRALVLRYECNRCHTIEGVPDADEHADCVGCHREIAEGTFDAPADALDEWRARVEPLSRTPSLRHVGERLRSTSIESFLLHPHDVRPELTPTMPRLEMSAEDARRIARYLSPAPERPSPFEAADVPRGRRVYIEAECARCHEYSGTRIPRTASHRLAPDLRFARERVRPERLVAWIRDPARLDPDTTMPATELPDADAQALGAFLMLAELEPHRLPAVPERLPVLERQVAWAEVEERVFRRVCWHCHSDPDFGLGDGGPGNDGGFGFAGRHVDLSSYEGVQSGGVDEAGEPRSLFIRNADGVPRLIETLLARQQEEAGQEVEGVRGMPLGMPALSAEDVQLVETWIGQGRPM